MIAESDVISFCDKHNYNIRRKKNARWIDQKCTPDVVWSVSDFILDYVENGNIKFTVRDIWNSEYAKESISETFSKPDTDETKAEDEYNKVFSQPICMLCYAGVLKDISKNSRHVYKVVDKDILEYIAKNDSNSIRFLCIYIEKVLRDSKLLPLFEEFFDKQTNTAFTSLKKEFISFYHKYTPIKGDYEPGRIFPKILNPIAYKYKKRGAKRGYISKKIIMKPDLMYNQDNFRDVYKDKPKDITRKEWLDLHPEIELRDGYFTQQMNAAKKRLAKFILQYRGNISELTMFIDNQMDEDEPSERHHIFPKSDFPELKHYIENLIALTPSQHTNYAHPHGNTHEIDLDAQKYCLIAKTHSIKQNLESDDEETIFEFENFIEVLATGWKDPSVKEIQENDYKDVLHAINCHYK